VRLLVLVELVDVNDVRVLECSQYADFFQQVLLIFSRQAFLLNTLYSICLALWTVQSSAASSFISALVHAVLRVLRVSCKQLGVIAEQQQGALSLPV
jgi:hypothetical protein